MVECEFCGDENASVTVIEFGDYRCPYCQQFEMSAFPRIKGNYVYTGKVKLSFINLAFLGQGSEQAANAGECVIDRIRHSSGISTRNSTVTRDRSQRNG